MSDGYVALHCAECGWAIGGLLRDQAGDVPRCLACGHASLVTRSQPDGTRSIHWPKPEQWPGWAVYARPTLDRALLTSESLN